MHPRKIIFRVLWSQWPTQQHKTLRSEKHWNSQKLGCTWRSLYIEVNIIRSNKCQYFLEDSEEMSFGCDDDMRSVFQRCDHDHEGIISY